MADDVWLIRQRKYWIVHFLKLFFWPFIASFVFHSPLIAIFFLLFFVDPWVHIQFYLPLSDLVTVGLLADWLDD